MNQSEPAAVTAQTAAIPAATISSSTSAAGTVYALACRTGRSLETHILCACFLHMVRVRSFCTHTLTGANTTLLPQLFIMDQRTTLARMNLLKTRLSPLLYQVLACDRKSRETWHYLLETRLFKRQGRAQHAASCSCIPRVIGKVGTRVVASGVFIMTRLQ